MKAINLLIFLILFSIKGFSQDTLFTIEGKTILCKVAEVGKDQVKYKSATDAEGQFTWIATFEVAAIHYQNGEREVLNNTTATSTSSTNDYNTAGQNNTNTSQNNYPDPSYTTNNHANRINNVMVGVRVVGFICRLALLLAGSNNCHNNNYNSYSSSYHAEVHTGPRYSGSGNSRSH